jgi:hypothetical protein
MPCNAASVLPSLEYISYRCSGEKNCLRKCVAHKALLQQIQMWLYKLEMASSTYSYSLDLYDQVLPSLPCTIEEDTALDLMIDKLILDDLEEQDRLNSGALGITG